MGKRKYYWGDLMRLELLTPILVILIVIPVLLLYFLFLSISGNIIGPAYIGVAVIVGLIRWTYRKKSNHWLKLLLSVFAFVCLSIGFYFRIKVYW